MGKHVIFTAIVAFLFIANVSNAAILGNTRKLVDSPPKNDSITSSSPIPSPKLPGNQSSPVGGEEKGKKKQTQPPPASSPGDEKSKDKQVTDNKNMLPPSPPPSPPPAAEAKEHKNNTVKEGAKDKGKETEKDNKKDDEKSEEKKEEKEEQKEKEEEKAEEKEEQKDEQKEKEQEKQEGKNKDKEGSKADTSVGSDESCDGKGRCEDLKSMTACIKNFDHESKLLTLLIQNKGGSSLKVDLTSSSSGKKHEVIDIPKHQNKMVNMSLADSGINEITLNAGNGHCVLHLGAPASQGNFFQQLPSYTKFMTPVYGAYFMLLITLIAGGVFACCCWFRKRKGQRDNIAYQELEMSMPESAVAVETAEWDEVWDDDWDEENAVRSPGGHSISANGLTSRNAKKGDWEDWDD